MSEPGVVQLQPLPLEGVEKPTNDAELPCHSPPRKARGISESGPGMLLQEYEEHLSRLNMGQKSLRFIAEQVEVQFDTLPTLDKKPICPNRFIWNEETYHVSEKLGEWQDFSRRGRMARNMRPEHAAVAEKRGSWGVGRFYFRVRTLGEQVFDLYYDRAPKSVDDRKGAWFLYREMAESED
ncbi:MAG: DUF6504 family protein [Anaerolineales bacterium]